MTMTNLQNIALIITVVLSTFSLLIGILNFSLSLKNRRNTIREKIFEKQLELFLEFNSLMGDILDKSNKLWSAKVENKDEIADELEKIVDELDNIISKNEIIIPDELNDNLTDLLSVLNNSLTEFYTDESSFTVEQKKLILKSIIAIYIDIEDYLAVEKLSTENMKISRGKRIESRLELERLRPSRIN